MTKTIQFLAWAFLILGCGILVFLLNKTSIDGFSISKSLKTNYEITGQFGDFVGGVVGTFFALAGTLLIFLTFKEQASNNKRTAFESPFFEMIRLYRSNINDLEYSKIKKKKPVLYKNRQVFRIIFKEFTECHKEVRRFSKSEDPTEYLLPDYEKKLNGIIEKNNPEINIIQLLQIDISYTIIFFGLGAEGESLVRKSFSNKYKPDYIEHLLFYMKQKPKKKNSIRSNGWEIMQNMTLDNLKKLLADLYDNRNKGRRMDGYKSGLSQEIGTAGKYEKYYGGHQFRLGHYYRHLYQSFKFLDHNPNLKVIEKYNYGKMLRAQLSTYEQALLLINSISTIGMKWEYTPELNPINKKPSKLISTYNLIKNLPGDNLNGIVYKTYYKNIDYEMNDDFDSNQ